MFIDQAYISIRAGDGGDGVVSFHTAKYLPNGGPDGGDGGRGGDVVFVARSGLSTLQAFRYKRHLAAQNGDRGGPAKRFGKRGADLVLEVPTGTIIRERETNRLLADLIRPDEPVVIAHGGRGGQGNARFANSVRQAPRFAKPGEAGQVFDLILELKLLADVGLIGLPNVGKSTLLSVISAAKPKIADYPFTTLQPQLGVVAYGDTSFVAADIPGLIEGAHAGQGLGLSFLRHIERTRLLLHLLDVSEQSGRDPLDDFKTINHELGRYDAVLLDKPQLVVLNKVDVADPKTIDRVRLALEEQGFSVWPLSAATGQGVQALLGALADQVQKLEPAQPLYPEEEHVYYTYEPQALFEVVREGEAFRVTGDWMERLVRTTPFEQHDSFQYFQRLIRKKGVIDALEAAGIQPGDLVICHNFEFEYQP